MRELKIIVCLKQVPDPEGPPSAFKVDSDAKKVIPEGIPPVINPFDENALEAALRLKDSCGGKVIAISMGEKLVKPVLRKALSVGADELILLEDVHFKELNSYSTAYVLSTAIKKIGEYDIILAGRQAGDWDFGQTGLIVAEILQIPSINLGKKLRVEDGKVVIEKLKRNGYEIVRTSMPALITISSEIGDLRMASVKAIKDAREKPLTVWGIPELEVEPQRLAVREIYRLSAPSRERKCTFIEGQALQEKGENLVIKLREDKVL